jgi:hypothetical protein
LQVAIPLGGYSTSASSNALFTYITSTYQKQASAISLLDLPLVGIETFLKGVMIFHDSNQVGGSSNICSALSSLPTPRSVL